MKRIFTSFLLLALCFMTTWANTEPVYDVPAPEANTRANAQDRLIMGLDVTGGTVDGAPVAFNSVVNQDGEGWGDVASQSEVYKDLTAETLEVTAGDQIHFDIHTRQLEWMHFYVYIDYNHDGKFDVDTELVSYSYLNGRNSLGYAVDPDNLFLPDFQIKEDAQAVQTRLRFKVDWDSDDPTGNKDPNNLIGNNRGTIIDYTINIHANVKSYAVNFEQPAEGGSFKVWNGTEELVSGAQVEEGTELTIEAAAAEGYELESYLVNGEAQTENTVVVAGETTIGVAFKALSVELNYAIPEGDKNIRRNQEGNRFGDRLLYTVTVNGATLDGQDAPFTSKINDAWGSQENVFVDKTAETVDMTAGDNIQLTFEHNIIWMHSYLYIDYNHDGVFNEDNELVAYSHFSEADTENGFNSLGEPTKHDCGIDIPAFTVANVDKDVTTRMRLKIDWNSKNPVGNETQSIGANAGTIVDFTVQLHQSEVAPVKQFAVTVEQPAMTDGTFSVWNGTTEVKGADNMIEEGTELTLTNTPAEGKEFVAYQVNGVDIEGNVVTVDQTMTLSAKFARKQVADEKFKVTFACNEFGTMSIQARLANNLIQDVYSGDYIENGADLIITLMPMEGKAFKAMINGVDKTADFEKRPGFGGFFPDYYEMTLTKPEGDQDINVEFIDPVAPQPTEKVTLTYSVSPAEGGTLLVRDAAANIIESGSEVAKGTENILLSVTPNKGYELKAVMINNKNYVDMFNEVVTGTYSYYIPTIEENTEIKVEFAQSVVATHKLTYQFDNAVCDLTVQVGADYLPNNSEFKEGSNLFVQVYPTNDDFEFTSCLINGEEKVNEFEYNSWMQVYGITLYDVKSDLDIVVTFDKKTGIAEATLAEVSYNAADQSLNIPAGAHAAVYNAAGQQVMSAEGGQAVSTANLATGAYIVRVANEAGVKVIKFIKK